MDKDKITKALQGFIAKHTEAGSRLVIFVDGWIEVEVVCDGTDAMMGYYCGLKPGHTGRCWSRNKSLNFDRD